MFDRETLGQVCSETGDRALFQGKGREPNPLGSL